MSDISQQLVTAIQTKYLANVQDILNVTHDDTLFAITTPILHHAIDDDLFDIFSLLLTRKFNFAVQDNKKHNILTCLLRAEKATQIKLLLNAMIKSDGVDAVYNELDICAKKSLFCPRIYQIIVQYGILDLVIYCYDNNKSLNKDAMNWAAANGHLDIVKWLYEHSIKCNVECSTDAMYYAAVNGHLDIVKWCHENNMPCTTKTMDKAVIYGYLDIVKYLFENIDFYKQNIEQIIIHAKNHDQQHIIDYLVSVHPMKAFEKLENIF